MFVAIIQKFDGTILKVVSLLAAKFILTKLAYLYEVFKPYIIELRNKVENDAIQFDLVRKLQKNLDILATKFPDACDT